MVLSTTLRPDIIMWSPGGKKIILVELTVPWDEGCEEAAEKKKRQIPATCPRLPGQGVDNMADDGGSRMSRIPSSICVESIDEGWTERPLEESSRSQAGRSIRESLQLALAQERGHKLEAWRRGALTWPVTADPPTGGCCG